MPSRVSSRDPRSIRGEIARDDALGYIERTSAGAHMSEDSESFKEPGFWVGVIVAFFTGAVVIWWMQRSKLGRVLVGAYLSLNRAAGHGPRHVSGA
jgi:hypothetical protein